MYIIVMHAYTWQAESICSDAGSSSCSSCLIYYVTLITLGLLVFQPITVLCSCCGMCSEDARMRDGNNEALETRARALILVRGAA